MIFVTPKNWETCNFNAEFHFLDTTSSESTVQKQASFCDVFAGADFNVEQVVSRLGSRETTRCGCNAPIFP